MSLGTFAGAVAGFVAPIICGAVGVPTAGMGSLACVVIVGGVSGMAGAELGSMGGEWLGQILYEARKRKICR